MRFLPINKHFYFNTLFLSLVSFSSIIIANPLSGEKTLPLDYKIISQKLIESALQDTMGFSRLAYLCDTFGPRLSGSKALEKTIDWILDEMARDGFDHVRGESVTVPHWDRGKESLHMISPRKQSFSILGLGGSIGTPARGIEAEIVVVSSFEELQRGKNKIPGKIVVYNAPFTNYGATVKYRTAGAVEAAKLGAVASLVRSVTPNSLNTPHTGGMRYEENIKKIPHAAITVELAEMLDRMTSRGERVILNLQMNAKIFEDKESRNIIGEIKGSENPEEIIVMGGHIDSWDVGQGAMDNAGGCLAAWEALRLIKASGLTPRRTIRVVMWTNEENGLRGAHAYAEEHKDELDNHILAIESDNGVFSPAGFSFKGADTTRHILEEVGQLLSSIQSGKIVKGYGGADISPLMKAGVPGLGLDVDEAKYFWYHHSDADTIDKLNRDEFNRCVATMAVMAYVIADMPQKLPRN